MFFPVNILVYFLLPTVLVSKYSSHEEVKMCTSRLKYIFQGQLACLVLVSVDVVAVHNCALIPAVLGKWADAFSRLQMVGCSFSLGQLGQVIRGVCAKERKKANCGLSEVYFFF